MREFKRSASFTTLQDVLVLHKGIGPGFDLLRISLALLILYGHCFLIAAGSPGVDLGLIVPGATIGNAASSQVGWTQEVWGYLHHLRLMLVLKHTDSRFANILVPMFFTLSGFLVTGSAFRTRTLRTFLVFRCLRIAPALMTEVCLSALILGPLLTIYPLYRYFSDPQFFSYFGNIIGRVRYELPGLFLSNPWPAVVNGNLWTLPAEFYCYLIIAGAIISGLLFNRLVYSVFFVLITGLVVVGNLFFGFQEGLRSVPIIVYYFFCGVFMYHWREYIPFSRGLFLLCIVGIYYHFVSEDRYILFFPLVTAYFTIYLGMVKFPRIDLFQRGDYSYGVYLYGFPIAQALVTIMPQIRGHGIWLVLLAYPCTFAFAVASWHLIEKPTLSLKKHFGRREAAVTSELIAERSHISEGGSVL
jgi:peptidoglycan/LPS O-acetylase OafA/YrhL